MATIELKSITSPETIKETLERELASAYEIVIKPKYIQITHDAAIGCVVRYKEKGQKTVCTLFGFAPSIGLRLAVLLGTFALATAVISLSMGELVISLGVFVPLIIAHFAMRLPSSELVLKVEKVMAALVVDDA